MIGDFMRECGGIDLVIEYMSDGSPDVQQRALMVLGNLMSDAVDPQASRTKQLFVQHTFGAARNCGGGTDVLLHLLESADWVTQMYACAAVQNLTENREFARQLAKRGTLKVLTRLLQSPQQRVVRFAAGALKNTREMLGAAAAPEEDDAPSLESLYPTFERRATRALSRASSALSPLRWNRSQSPSKLRGKYVIRLRYDPAPPSSEAGSLISHPGRRSMAR